MATEYTTPIVRHYIDVRPSIPAGRSDPVELPLLDTLPADVQTKIKAFMRPADRLMSLASALLKNLFIHRYALIPWDEVRVSRTPDPHRRPYWDCGARSTGTRALEFNVSHQNGLVVLVGCRTPDEQSQKNIPFVGVSSTPSSDTPPTPESARNQVRLGVDLACANEHGRTPSDMTTQKKLDEWVDIFEEMFSPSCRKDIKTAKIPGATSSEQTIQGRFRRFYAYWSLKEAFIKMVGEGLLAEWLSKLEFDGVVVPSPPKKEDFPDDGFSWALRTDEEIKWSAPEHVVKSITASLYGKRLDDVQMSLSAFEEDFLCATAMRGVKDKYQDTEQERWVKIDIETEIRSCAEGRCACLHSMARTDSQC
jgi:4'-phosphopantetheinyl transferase